MDGVSEGGEASALTAAVIELAGILNLRPVAEGIERADQLQRLLELHCDLGQGFFFAKPLPGDELQALLTERVSMQRPRPMPWPRACPGRSIRHLTDARRTFLVAIVVATGVVATARPRRGCPAQVGPAHRRRGRPRRRSPW